MGTDPYPFRPCRCGRCVMCQWIVDSPDMPIVRRWAGERHPAALPPARPGVSSLPCLHVGPAAGPLGWHYCEYPDAPLGDVVCSCKGCGPRCPGYSLAVP